VTFKSCSTPWIHRLATSLLIPGCFFVDATNSNKLVSNNLAAALLLVPNILIACLIFFAWQYFRHIPADQKIHVVKPFQRVLGEALVAYFVLAGYDWRAP